MAGANADLNRNNCRSRSISNVTSDARAGGGARPGSKSTRAGAGEGQKGKGQSPKQR